MNFDKIKLLVLDADGVLTDGKLYIGANGEIAKCFSVLDGMGISLALRNGIDVAIITGRSGDIVKYRANELGIKHCYIGIKDKKEQLQKLMNTLNVGQDEVAYMGDDLNDLPSFAIAGLKMAVKNAVAEVLQNADYVTANNGGCGAVREVVEKILIAQKKWDKIVTEYLQQGQGDKQ
ncbi:MAG: HAD-IIIA family hydrolase [Phascolarctobacterium sp.]|nr:HAD-IIIA family hydrolase [Candidatus Phascolarctobacterium caballi]